MDPLELDRLLENANSEMLRLSQPLNFNFDFGKERELAGLTYPGVEQVSLAGPELVLGRLYDDIGFDTIKDELFRHMVIARLCYPVGKLKTIDYLHHCKGVSIDAERIFLYLERLYNKQKERVQEISCNHAKIIQVKAFKEVICYMAPLHYESGDQNDLKFSSSAKEGKKQHPHLYFALFVNTKGDPLAYELFEGQKHNGHSLLSAVEAFKTKYRTKHLLLVADNGMLTDEQSEALQGSVFEYLLGTRLKSEDHLLLKQIKALKLKNGQYGEIMVDAETRLVVSYSVERAEKERANRQRGLEKLERAIQSGKLSRININNRGYNKYLKPIGKSGIVIDYRRFKRDEKWDGLKGTLTNTKLDGYQVEDQYGNLSRIGNAFRISQSDLHSVAKDRPAMPRIEAHFSIAFCAYKIYHELERALKLADVQWSADQAIQIAKSILEITVQAPSSPKSSTHLHLQNEEQRKLLELFKR